nr:NADH dehydrogenase subunit 4 [Acostemma sp.]
MMGIMLYMFVVMLMLTLFDCWILYQFMLIFIMFFICLHNVNSFFSFLSYGLGMDFYSYGLIILSFLICCLMVSPMSYLLKSSFSSYYLCLNLFMMIILLVIFSSLSLLYMYMYFEFVLIPLTILILGWGYQPERLLSGLYLIFYTLFASLPLLMLIIYMYNILGSSFFDYLCMQSSFFFEHLFILMAFLVKLPMFMFHFWLPKAHVQAPISGSMILAGLMLKIGGYGLIRIMFIYEFMFMKYSYIWYSLSLYGSVLVGLMCFIQGDMKSLIAYSSISHMGMCLMGILTMSKWGLIGSYLMMISHGFCSSALFYMSNLIYERTSSRSFYINKGMMMFLPSSSMFFFIFCSFNMGCPPSLNFISEIFLLNSMMMYWIYSSVYFFFISFFCACFSFYLYSFSQHGLYHNLYSFSCLNVMEFLNMYIHMFPLFFSCFFLMLLI